MPPAAPAQPPKVEPLSALLSAVAFPNRQTLSCHDVAKTVGCTARHVRNLCAEGTIVAFNVAGASNTAKVNFWRIPTSSYDLWLQRRSGPAY